MANALVVMKTSGPLPQTVSFNSPSDGPAILFVSGSGWTGTSGGVPISTVVTLDGNMVGAAGVYTNEASSHKAFVPFMFPMVIGVGAHSLTLANGANTTTDSNDAFEVVLIY